MAVSPIADEKGLLIRLRSGDRQAFEAIYRHYSPPIYSKILKLSQSETLADELLQDTFVRIWEKCHLIDPNLSFKAWLYKIAENELYLFYRKVARDKRLQEHLNTVFAEAYTHTEEMMYRKDRQALLHQAMDQLSPQRRQVFTLCKLQGKSYEEAGAILGISSSTVSNHLVKATDTIRQYLSRSRESLLLLFLALYEIQ